MRRKRLSLPLKLVSLCIFCRQRPLVPNSITTKGGRRLQQNNLGPKLAGVAKPAEEENYFAGVLLELQGTASKQQAPAFSTPRCQPAPPRLPDTQNWPAHQRSCFLLPVAAGPSSPGRRGPPPRLPVDEDLLLVCRQMRWRSPSSWAAWADWLAQAVTNRISSVLVVLGIRQTRGSDSHFCLDFCLCEYTLYYYYQFTLMQPLNQCPLMFNQLKLKQVL